MASRKETCGLWGPWGFDDDEGGVRVIRRGAGKKTKAEGPDTTFGFGVGDERAEGAGEL